MLEGSLLRNICIGGSGDFNRAITLLLSESGGVKLTPGRLSPPPVLVQPKMESARSPLVSYLPFWAGISKASGSTDPMEVWGSTRGQFSGRRTPSR